MRDLGVVRFKIRVVGIRQSTSCKQFVARVGEATAATLASTTRKLVTLRDAQSREFAIQFTSLRVVLKSFVAAARLVLHSLGNLIGKLFTAVECGSRPIILEPNSGRRPISREKMRCICKFWLLKAPS